MRGTLVVIAIAGIILAPAAQAILPPKCFTGEGLAKKGDNPLGVAKPGECKVCADDNCNDCSSYYMSCSSCEAGFGFDSKKKCTPCAPVPVSKKKCGVCSADYSKCDAVVTECPSSLSKAGGGKKMAWDPFSGKNNYCPNKPGLVGNGRSSVFTATVKKGTCLDCQGPDFRPFTDGDIPFCDIDAVGRQVAAAAFKPKAKCPYPGSIKFVLDRTCVTQRSTLPFFIDLQYKAEYCGEKKTVVASGGGQYVPTPGINPAADWEWAVKK